MKKLVLVIFLACSCDLILDKEVFIDARLAQFVEVFYAEAHARNKNYTREIVARIEDLPEGVAGRGYIATPLKNPVILIDEEFYNDWINQNPLYIEVVVLHELGHAVLERSHSTQYSIMNVKEYQWNYVKFDSSKLTLLNELYK